MIWDRIENESISFKHDSGLVIDKESKLSLKIIWLECKLGALYNLEKQQEILAAHSENALIKEGLHTKKEYVERTKIELEDIKFLGFENYFLVMN